MSGTSYAELMDVETAKLESQFRLQLRCLTYSIIRNLHSYTSSSRMPRYQLRFRKEGDLCWIGHHDLVRAIERTFRRAELPLAMSGRFSPKPRLSFPSALALGIVGLDEVCDVELSAPIDASVLLDRLRQHAPPGWTVTRAEPLPVSAPSAVAQAVEYTVPVPAASRPQLRAAVERLLAQSECLVTRDEARARQVDLRADLLNLELADDALRIRLRVTRAVSARPRELLAALEINDLERASGPLARTKVELYD